MSINGTLLDVNSTPGNRLRTGSTPRDKMEKVSNDPVRINLTDLRVHDALQTNLPGTAATDDLALIGGTFGTDTPTVQSSDGKATSITQRARFLVPIPPEYVDADSLTLRIRAAMNTTVSDSTATVDVEAYLHDDDGAVTGSDLYTGAAQSINSLTFADVDFTLTPTNVVAGDMLDIRITVAITDSATGTAVIGEISSIKLLCDTQG